ncbi:MAG: integrase [Acidianus sp.]|uniref:integrase n=1 Tax=Acidianus sp. TaxID=1872104 RepID=UPI00397B0518
MVANLRQYATEGNLNAFREYLLNEKKLDETTVQTRLLYLKPGKKIVFNNQSVKSYRAFAKFLALHGIISEDFANEILKELKTVRTQSDLRVPTLDDIKRTLQLAKEYSENVYLVYRLALESGSRLSEILRVLKDPSQDICDGSICYYPLAWQRGYKGVFYVFHLTPLHKVDITRHAIANFERRRDALAIKYFRKFVATKMAELGIPLDVIDFIQGRKPTRVLTQHYVSLFGIAKEHYKKYAEWLTSVI